MQRLFRALLVLTIIAGTLTPVGGRLSQAQAATFDPGAIVTDAYFTASSSMSVSDIQAFLVQQGSVLATLDPSVLGADTNGRSAAQVIYDASHVNRTDFGRSSGYGASNPLVMNLNPQVLLVTLQKEQSLITAAYVAGSGATTAALQTAMGYGCPDSGGCDPAYAGFTDQVTYAAAQFMLNYYQAANLSYVPGQTYTFTNTQGPPYNAPATQQVTISNASTSSLYRYTPHVYNGNYNFWYYQQKWFGAPLNTFGPNARVIKSASSVQVYAADSGLTQKWPVASLDYLTAWGITASIETLPDAQVAAIPNGIGAISRLAQSSSGPSVYFIENGHKHHIGDEREFSLYNLSWSELAKVDDSILSQLPEGPPIGLLSKSPTQPQVYFLTLSRKYYIPDEATLYNWGFTWNDVNVIPQSVLDSFPNAGNLTSVAQFEGLAPVYVVTNGQRLYVTTEAILKDWGLSFSMLSNIGKERALVTTQGHDLTRVAKGSGPSVYYISGGQKHYVSSWSRLAAKGASPSDLITVSDYFLNRLPTGSSL